MAKDTRPYFTVTNELFRHPKWLSLPNDKTRLYLLELWGHCNEFRTDGKVLKQVLQAKGAAISNALIAGGWVEKGSSKDEFVMHDYLEHQPSRDEIEDRIQDKRERGSRGGKESSHKRWHVQRGIFKPDCDLCVDIQEA